MGDGGPFETDDRAIGIRRPETVIVRLPLFQASESCAYLLVSRAGETVPLTARNRVGEGFVWAPFEITVGRFLPVWVHAATELYTRCLEFRCPSGCYVRHGHRDSGRVNVDTLGAAGAGDV